MAATDPSVLVVAPAHDEEQRIADVVRGVLSLDVVTAMVVVDDCSSDDTRRRAADAGATVLSHERNLGVGAAIRTGIKYAAEHGYDIVAVISGDGQHEPSELPRLISGVAEGRCEIAQGTRFARGGRVVGREPFRVVMIRLYSVIFSLLSGCRLSDATNGLRAFRSRLFSEEGIDIDQQWLNAYELEPYILYSAATRGLRIAETPCTVVYHGDGRYTQMRPVIDWWKLLRPLVFLRLGLRS